LSSKSVAFLTKAAFDNKKIALKTEAFLCDKFQKYKKKKNTTFSLKYIILHMKLL
jgi:hypothetical protein